MGRGKAKLEWIANNSSRRTSFRKREASLIKKVSELSILCGVDACAIINGPDDPKPEVWPSPKEAQRVINRFKSMPEMERSQKMMNQESDLKQRIVKLDEQVKKQQFANREIEIADLMNQTLAGKGLEDVRIEELDDLDWVIEKKMKKIQGRLVDLRTMSAPQLITGAGIEAETDAVQRQSLFMEGMDPPAGQQPAPTPFSYGYYGGDDSVMLPYGDSFPGPNGFYP